MATKNKIRIIVEINPEDRERLQNIALALGIVQVSGPNAFKTGSISRLMQEIASGEIRSLPLPVVEIKE